MMKENLPRSNIMFDTFKIITNTLVYALPSSAMIFSVYPFPEL